MSDEIKDILDRCTPYLFGDEVDKLYNYISNLQQELEKARIENEVLKEQMVAMVQPTYTYGIRGGSSER